jgi:glycosyltransferase involved in cell wall biosynthesis
MRQLRVMLFATHPMQFNGYSKIAWEFARSLAERPDIHLTYFGFQNFHDNQEHKRLLPPHVYVHDAWKHEEPKAAGFGFTHVTAFVSEHRPDVVFVYNDMMVIQNILQGLHAVPNRKFKIVLYVDQVYLCQKSHYIRMINQTADYAVAFTPYWQKCLTDQGMTLPNDYLRHGFDPKSYYPVPRHLARRYFGLGDKDFIILNLNRNQPRKRWDLMIMAFAEIVARHQSDPIKLLIGTQPTGSWDLLEIFARELGKRGLTLMEGMKHIILVDRPQMLTDFEVNIMYNVANIGINTCDGEGFGMCNFEQAAVGVPQIVPKIGGFLDFFDDTNALMIPAKHHYYVDSSRDGVGGEAEVMEVDMIVEAIERYYADDDLVARHGKAARERILRDYKWKDIGDRLYDILKRAAPVIEDAPEAIAPTPAPTPSTPVLTTGKLTLPVVQEDPESEEHAVEAHEEDTKTKKKRAPAKKKAASTTTGEKRKKKQLLV